MKNIDIITLFVLCNWSAIINAQSPNFLWAKHFGGLSEEIAHDMVIDADGNVYTIGEFNGVADFNPSDDPNTGTFGLVSAGYQDIFVSKLDAYGNFLWAKRFGGNFTDRGHAMALDVSGNIYMTGYFSGTADFDPGPGTYNLTGAGNEDIFIAKLDPSGNLIWARRIGGTSADIAYDIVVNSIGNVTTTGRFRSTVDFDPGPGIYNLSAGYIDIFISTLDANGNFLWAKQIVGELGGSGNRGNAIAIDAFGNIYTTGYFSNTCDFDPGPETYNLATLNNTTDIFVSKLDPSGNFLWAKQMGGSLSGSDRGNSLAIDVNGNVYMTGYFNGTTDFNPSPFGTYNLSGGQGDVFVSKLDANGDFLWAKQMGGLSSDEGNSIVLDTDENVFVTGSFRGIADFDPGNEVYNLNSAGEEDIFVARLDASGNFAWAVRMGGTLPDESHAIAVDSRGSIYTAGYFFSIEADFDPGNGTYYLSPFYTSIFSVYADAFVEKLCQLDAPTITTDGGPILCQGGSVTLMASLAEAYLWSNGATTQSITVSTSGNYSVTVFNSAGCSAASAVTTIIVNPVPPVPDVTSDGHTTFCEGDSVTLTASLASSYQWNNGATTRSITVTSSGDYRVTVANAAGCTAVSEAITVDVQPAPTASVVPGDPVIRICENSSVVLTAGPATSYLWSNGATTQSITVSFTGIYSVTVANAAGCTAASPATSVIVEPAPIANITPGGPAITICEENSVTLTAGPANSYLWSNGAITQSITVSSAGDYSVIVANTAGCSATSAVVSVVVQPNPSAAITADGPTAFCPGDSVVLTVSGGGTYLWNNGATTQNITVFSTGNYSVNVTTAAGCTAAADTSVAVLPVAILSLLPNNTNCDNEDGSILVNASGGSPVIGYTWNNGDTTQDLNNLPGGTYSVTATDINGCTVKAQATVIARTSPMVDLGPDISIDQGQEVNLTAIASEPGLTYLWSTGETTSTITVEEEGIYLVTVTNSVGCMAMDSVMVTVIVSTREEPEGFTITVSPNPVRDVLYIKCEGRPTTLARLIDVAGRPVHFDRSFIADGAMRTMRLDDLPAGVYFLEVKGKGVRKVVGITKVKD